MDILFLCLAILIGIMVLKLFVWLVKAGVFLIILPIKIILAIILWTVLLVLMPFAIIPAIVSVLISLLPIILIVAGTIFLIKYAL